MTEKAKIKVVENSLSVPAVVLPGTRDGGTKDKGRAWCFTLPDESEYDIVKLQSIQCERLVIGREVGKETGYKHLQCYIRFKEPKRFSWWKQQFPKAHVELRKGTETQATQYCKKDGDVIIDWGFDYDEPVKSMKRDDEAIQIIKEIESGLSFGQVRQRHKLFCFWNRVHVLKYIKDEQWFKENEVDPEF